ncbi:MAG TPA: ABC transporter permease, partial [Candidatus Acidoferrales bacterium]|nr:ABC transporter permease [Candidatus Acidoferrales bacterium]
QARYAALRTFGNLGRLKEECRDAWGVRMVSELAQDLRYGLRQLRRNPGFTVVAVITLALGIGANTAIFSVVNAVLLRPLPYPDAEQLVNLSQWRQQGRGGNIQTGVSLLNVLDLTKQEDVFQAVGYFHWQRPFLSSVDSPKYLLGADVSTNFIELLGVEPLIGRGFTPQEAQPGEDRVAILSYRLWQEQFGGIRDAIGKSIQLDGKFFTVVGVMPKNFYFVRDLSVDVMTPLVLTPKELEESQRSTRNLNAVGRLKPGAAIKKAQVEANAIAARLAAAHPDADAGWGFKVEPLRFFYYSPDTPRLLTAVWAAAFLVLLIACVNVANLLLVRSTARRKELALRAALGAGGRRLFAQLLAESVLLATVGGLAAIPLSWAAMRLLTLATSDYLNVAGTQWIGLNDTVIAFCLALALICGLIFGLVPFFHAAKLNLNNSLKEGGAPASAEGGGRRMRDVLAVCEIGLAMVLVTGAGLMLRTFVNILRTDLGIDRANVLTFDIGLPEFRYKTALQQADFFKAALERFRTMPGVESAAGFTPGGRLLFRPEGQTAATPDEESDAIIYGISPGFIHTMRASLIAGREFTNADDESAPPVAIINETLARRCFPRSNPVGQYLIPLSDVYGLAEAPTKPIEIVGLTKDMKMKGVRENTAYIYEPYTQYTSQAVMIFALRTKVPPLSMVSTVRAAAKSLDKEIGIGSFETFDQEIASWESVRFPMFFIWAFAGLGLFLSSIGIFGVISFSVSRRSHEIGIRMALGAQKADVLRMVIGQGIRLTFIGVGIGICGALALTRFLSSLLYGVKPTDPLTFIAVSLILIGVALAACYIPARRAAQVDPMVALRYE